MRRLIRHVPGAAGVVCAVTGVALLAGGAWAVLTAAGLLLLIDRRIP